LNIRRDAGRYIKSLGNYRIGKYHQNLCISEAWDTEPSE
jgi:hypothetical protein